MVNIGIVQQITFIDILITASLVVMVFNLELYIGSGFLIHQVVTPVSSTATITLLAAGVSLGLAIALGG